MATESPNTGRDTDRQSDLAVMSANEYKQKRRLERILDAMDKIEYQDNLAWDRYVTGENTHDAKNIMIQRAVKEAVREAYKLLINHFRTKQSESDNGEGAVRDRYWLGTGDDPIGVIRREHADNIPLLGLKDFLGTEEIYHETWQEKTKGRNSVAQVEEHEREYTVPEQISWEAALRLKEFLDDVHDLEIKFEELEDRRPYDDWREEFETGVYHGPDSVELPHRREE